MGEKTQIPAGYVIRDKAVEISGMSGREFDRLAPKVFQETRIKRNNAFLYLASELEVYRKILEKSKEDKTSPPTWAESTEKIRQLEERIRVLSWALSPTFGEGEVNNKSALRIQKDRPEDYDRAKRVLKELGFDLEELRSRLEKEDSRPPKPNPPPQTVPAFDELPSF